MSAYGTENKKLLKQATHFAGWGLTQFLDSGSGRPPGSYTDKLNLVGPMVEATRSLCLHMNTASPRIAIEYSGKLFAEQVRLLYHNAPLAYAVTLVNGAILVFAQRQYIS